MSKFIRIATLIWMILAGVATTNINIIYANELPELKEEVQQQIVSQRIYEEFINTHYRQFILDMGLASRIFDRYLNMLDYSHNILTISDIEQFAIQRAKIIDELKSGKLNLFYAMYNLAGKRRFERYQYALAQLNKPMDLNGHDVIEVDRSKAMWPKNMAELNTLWNTQVKHDALNLKLINKDEKEIRNILTKRYQFIIQRIMQNNSEDVFQLIMNAFAHELDPHTNYLSPHNTEQFNIEMSLSFEGIGVVLHTDDYYTVIKSLIPGGPAVKSKVITVGDRVVGVGQTDKFVVDVIGWRLDDVVSLIKGPKGSKVYLEILPFGKSTKTHIVTITRECMRLEEQATKTSIKTIGEEKIGVLNIPRFYVGLTDDVKIQLQKLEEYGVQSVIIDLRANGGGALAEAVSLSGLFIPSGPIVQLRDKNGKIREKRDIDGIIYYKGPLVVLVDRFSASASEIFSAAMQDYGRALVVGEPTFGKGTVQRYSSLSRIYDQMLHPEWPVLGSIQYTIQKFYRINGDSTQCKGVVPDIVMFTNVDTGIIGEKFEDNALPWDSINATTYTKIGDMNFFAQKLVKAHEERIAKNSEFQYMQHDIARFYAIKNKYDWIPLNTLLREKLIHDDSVVHLQRANKHLMRQGKEPVKSIEAVPNDFKEMDSCLDEAVQIALDFAHINAI